MRKFLRIEYHSYNSDNPLNESEQLKESALARLDHLTGVFNLLKYVDIANKPDSVDELNCTLHSIGELSAYLADGLFGEIHQLGELLEEVTTFNSEEVN